MHYNLKFRHLWSTELELNPQRKVANVELKKQFEFLFKENPDWNEINNQIKTSQPMYENELALDLKNFAE